ncbi:MAG: branched-chain amino acid ABC transporter ATP-binding protein/permease [Rhodospirillales bacterium]|nr:branched-chain amino acid ABC transporter ATP-binding protein/permease [Rhodospirillales bacterium]
MGTGAHTLTLARYLWEPVVLGAGLLLIVVSVWASGDRVIERAAIDGLIHVVLVIGLYIFIGNSGVLAFGNMAFMMIGAYAVAWFTMSPFKKSFALNLPAFLADNTLPLLPSAIMAALLAAMVAALLAVPLMRLSGIAASIGTFAALMVLYTLYSNWDSWTFGAGTLAGVPIYVDMWVALAWCAVALLVATIYQKSRFGLALRASREDHPAARAVGIDVPTQRIIAFVLGAFFMGIGGVLKAHFIGSIAVKTFWLGPTFVTLAMLIVGGQRSLTGAVVGVVTVAALLEFLRQLEAGLPIGDMNLQSPRYLRELGIALVMLVILIVRPSGITMGREIPWPFGERSGAGARAAADALRADPAAAPAKAEERLEARDVAVRFEGLAAVDGVSFALGRHEILGLIGPNGAGKTTIVNVLTGFQKPTRGTIVVDGVDATGWAPHRLGRAGVVRTFQAVRLFRDLPVIENLEAAAIGVGLNRRPAVRRASQILRWMNFEHRGSVRASSLPYGDERRVGIGRALAAAPRFILLDEPAAGMSDAECDELMALISRIPIEFGCGVLLIEHNMRVIMGVCDRVHVIDSGRTIAEGSPQEIRSNPAVIRAYLGSKDQGGGGASLESDA